MYQPQKRKLVPKTIVQKCQAINDLENGMSNKEVALKYGVPKNTVSIWVKNKEKLVSSHKALTCSKQNNLCGGGYEEIDKAVYQRFLVIRSQQVPINGMVLKEKSIEYAKELGKPEFKASDDWLNSWKESYIITLHSNL